MLGFALAGIAVLLGAQFTLVHRASKESIVGVTERLCEAASADVSRRAGDRLRAAADVVGEFEREVRAGTVAAGDPLSVESALLGAAVRRHQVTEVAFTWGRLTGHDERGRAILAPEGRGQIAVERRIGPEGGLFVRRTTRGTGNGPFRAALRRAGDAEATMTADAPDPTLHLTFATPANVRFADRLLWSDLHHAELDATRPPGFRRNVVSAQKAVADEAGVFLGVVRVSLSTERLDEITRIEQDADAPHAEVFLCDRAGRVIAPAAEAWRLEETDDGLRVPRDAVPPLTRRALDEALPESIPESGRPVVTHFTDGGRSHLAAFAALPDSQEWLVGVLVPEDAYTQDLERSRTRLLAAASVVGVAMLAGGVLAARAAGRRFGAIVRETDRMGAFDFAATPRAAAPFAVREIESVLDGMERAKSALRALSKFVPVDLVRRLHAEGAGDPRPGGELRELSILFSDIEGFTSLAERTPPDALAEIMSLYFDRMTREVHATRGIVDKFIGDAVMALWNAPESVAGHAAAACRAALACVEAERALQATPEWTGHPRIRTRFGIHTDVVLVGNIGSRERLNFTALGDGVNLASRLEGLNKAYGTSILVSEAVVSAARAAGFPADAFRRIDRVAVKGREGGVFVFELLEPGARGAPRVERYEAALDLYFARDFAGAAALLASTDDDPPSAVLRARCLAFLDEPPPAAWDGVSVRHEK